MIDHGVVIPEGLVVGEDPELDAKRFRVSEKGICLITQADDRQAGRLTLNAGPCRHARKSFR